MTIVPVEESEMNVRQLIRRVKRSRGAVVLTRRGKPVLLVQDATGEDWETIALSTNPDFVRFINKRRESAKKHGTIAFDDVCKELGLKPLSEK